jgi:hypothetical protein
VQTVFREADAISGGNHESSRLGAPRYVTEWAFCAYSAPNCAS